MIAHGRSNRRICVAVLFLILAILPDRVVLAQSSCVRLRIRWTVYQNAPPTVVPGSYPTVNAFSIVTQQVVPGDPPRRRGRMLGQIVVVAASGLGAEVYRTGLADPRILRMDDGEGGGELYHRSQPTFMFDIPNNASITQLRFYEVLHVNGESAMSLVGTMPITLN